MKTFVIIFVLAVLFVVGSASAMRYFGGPVVKKRRLDEPQNRDNSHDNDDTH